MPPAGAPHPQGPARAGAGRAAASDLHRSAVPRALAADFSSAEFDGVLHLQTEADIKIATPLALRLKLMSDLDISEKRLPQDGRFAVKVKQQRIDVRISTMPTFWMRSAMAFSGLAAPAAGLSADVTYRTKPMMAKTGITNEPSTAISNCLGFLIGPVWASSWLES